MENIKSARPMTHDLLYNVILETGYKLEKIEINDLNSDTYYASLSLINTEGQTHKIDSRPSDAIALALRADAPIFCTTNVVSNGTITTDQEVIQGPGIIEGKRVTEEETYIYDDSFPGGSVTLRKFEGDWKITELYCESEMFEDLESYLE